jgi:hypothetical protein
VSGPFDVVDRVGDVAVFRDGPKPRGPADRHGALDLDGERVAVFVQSGPAWPVGEVLERGRKMLPLRHRNLARPFWFDSARNKYHWVIERPGGVALAALVRRVRKRDGAMPPVAAARIARDVVRAQLFIDAVTPRERFASLSGIAAVLADTVVAWDGRVVVAPRMFGAPADAPSWMHRSTLVEAVGVLLLALLAPALPGHDGADEKLSVDNAVLRMLAAQTPLRGTGAAELEALVAQAMNTRPTPPRRGRPTPPASARILALDELAQALAEIVRLLGGDDESFAAALMNELFPDRKRADVAWREEMLAVPLS